MKEGIDRNYLHEMFPCPEDLLQGFFIMRNQEFIPAQNSKFLTWLKRGQWLVPLSLVLGILIWQGLTQWLALPAFILPGPIAVWKRLLRAIADGSLLENTWITLVEILLGLLTGSSLATFFGYLLAKSMAAERLLSPYLIASQAVPTVAIAPLLVIWFGSGLFSKVLICALTVFFPVLVNTMVGLRAVPDNLKDLMASLRATPLQTLRYLEIPAALPIFLGGLRIGATLSVIGAVVGEFVGSNQGLGFLINVARGQYDTAMVFVALITLIILAICLYLAFTLLETHLLAWQKKD